MINEAYNLLDCSYVAFSSGKNDVAKSPANQALMLGKTSKNFKLTGDALTGLSRTALRDRYTLLSVTKIYLSKQVINPS